jgi:hypothetical protein
MEVSSQRSTSSKPLLGLRYFGYYSVATPEVLSHHGNLIFTVSAAEIQQAAKFNIKAFHRVGGALTSADDAQWSIALGQWKLHADSIRPFISNIAAFYLYDEPYGQLGKLGRPEVFRRLQRAARVVKQTFPGTPIGIAEAADNLTNYYSKQPFAVPPEIDWVGFDCYGGMFSDCGASHRSIPAYLALLEGAVDLTKQRVFLIPPSFHLRSSRGPESEILSVIRQGGPCTLPPNCKSQDSLVAIARQYLALARSDQAVVAIMAFGGGLYEESHNLLVGALDMPRVRTEYDQIFSTVPGSNAQPNLPYPTGAQIVIPPGGRPTGEHFAGDTTWAAIEILDAQNRQQLGVNVECTPSEDADVMWRTRPTGTNHPTNAFFGWILGSLAGHTYTLHCQSPATGSLSVTFSVTTSKSRRSTR